MTGDNITRLLLLGILVCLVALLFRGSGEGGAVPGWGRYQVTGTRAGSPLLIRTDTVTGKVWKLELRGGDERWQLFADDTGGGAGGGQPAQAAEATPEAAEPPGAPGQLADDTSAMPAEPPGPRGPRIKFAPRKPPPPSTVPADAPLDLDSLATALGREDVPLEIRIWAVGQLAAVDEPRATDLLLRALRSDDAKLSAAAAEALRGRDDPEVAKALEEAGGP